MLHAAYSGERARVYLPLGVHVVDIWDLTKLVFRRWYVFLPLLVITVALVMTAGVSVKPDYSATGHIQLIPATESASDARDAGRLPNPWSDLVSPRSGLRST